MAAYLEVWKPSGRELLPLEGERVTIGRATGNDLALARDSEVSRLHAVLERFAVGWCLRDLGSSNGTFVQGRRISREHVLHADDEIRVGSTRMQFRVEREAGDHGARTVVATGPPELTRREREVLMALCWTMVVDADAFTEPASIRQIATELSVTDAAIKQHLLRLYDKFRIDEPGGRRRVRLANEALRRGAVTVAELQGAARSRCTDAP